MAKQPSVTSRTPLSTNPTGRAPANANGKATAVVANEKAVRWASPNQNPTTSTAAKRSRQSSTAEKRASRGVWPSRTTKIEATEKNQFSTDQKIQTRNSAEAARTNGTAG